MTESPTSNEPAEPTTAPTQTPEAPPLRPGESRPRGIRFNDRILIIGPTGCGKSVLLNFLFWTAFRCQRLLVDTKDEFSVPGVEPVTSVAAIDWSQPIIHFVDDSGSLRDYDRLFQACLQRKAGRQASGNYGLMVCVHELGDLCGDSPGATPPYVSAYVRKGRAHGLGLLGGSQRPVNMPKVARTEAQHVFAFVPGFDPDDQQVVARLVRMTEPQLNAALEAASRLSPTGEHSYLWYDERARPTTVIRPPLPLETAQRAGIRGLDPTREHQP